MISVHCDTNDPYRTYGVIHFLQKYGIPLSTEAALHIVYEEEENTKGFKIKIVENDMQECVSGYLKGERGGKEKAPVFEKPLKLKRGKTLLTFSDDEEEYPCVTMDDDTIIIGFDIFNEVGHILSGYLERFWKEGEDRYKQQLTKTPVVDYYERILFECIMLASRRLGISLRLMPFWPNGKKFAVCLTHDVDRVHKSYQYLTYFIRYLKKGDLHASANQIRSLARRLRGEEPYWNFERIIEIERNLSVKSTFFFLNERKKTFILSPKEWKLYWGRYDIRDARIVEMIKKLDAGGWEIGVHGSYNSYRDFDLMREEKRTLEEILGKSVHGISQHYCNLETPLTWEYQEKLGFMYDASLGFVTDIGFRWGTCHPFHPFNPENGRILSLWELPITIMDNACAYKSWDDIMEIIKTVERYNGILLLRWHQAVFNEREFPGRSEIYERIIRICKERNAWITDACDVVKWLAEREELYRINNHHRIE